MCCLTRIILIKSWLNLDDRDGRMTTEVESVRVCPVFLGVNPCTECHYIYSFHVPTHALNKSSSIIHFILQSYCQVIFLITGYDLQPSPVASSNSWFLSFGGFKARKSLISWLLGSYNVGSGLTLVLAFYFMITFRV